MKFKNLILPVLMLLTFSIFGNVDPIKINTEKSTISWVGKKITGQHIGTISIKSGELLMDDDKLTGGSFVIDMSSLSVEDLKAGQGKEKLEGHLNSDDFFGINKYPEATLSIINVIGIGKGQYKVQANITIKDKLQEISFDANVGKGMATAEITIDRTKHDIRYGSGSFFDNLGDNMINDDFVLTVNLVFQFN